MFKAHIQRIFIDGASTLVAVKFEDRKEKKKNIRGVPKKGLVSGQCCDVELASESFLKLAVLF